MQICSSQILHLRWRVLFYKSFGSIVREIWMQHYPRLGLLGRKLLSYEYANFCLTSLPRSSLFSKFTLITAVSFLAPLIPFHFPQSIHDDFAREPTDSSHDLPKSISNHNPSECVKESILRSPFQNLSTPRCAISKRFSSFPIVPWFLRNNREWTTFCFGKHKWLPFSLKPKEKDVQKMKSRLKNVEVK